MINRQKTISKMLIELPDNVTLVAENWIIWIARRKKFAKILLHMKLIK